MKQKDKRMFSCPAYFELLQYYLQIYSNKIHITKHTLFSFREKYLTVNVIHLLLIQYKTFVKTFITVYH